MSSGQKLWIRAKKIIPGGNQLLSKRSEKFLPDLWPAYYAKAKGAEVWGIDGKRYLDFAQMGVGTCILGYADLDVNAAVIRAVKQGSMCTLNCPEEVDLAEELIKLHPWAGMVRFARTGGEACAIAVRIARAAVGKNKVAFCGYHGWHDWYLAANLGNSTNLDGQLLPGLMPRGVPRELTGTSVPFEYNNLESLKSVFRKEGKGIGVIIMEPQRARSPSKGFLEGVRKIASERGAVLIFDEVTSGFRMNLGGIHLTYGVIPDIAVFGKALGNGYPISAVVGTKKVMDACQESFISSTFWTEKVGYAAALATIKKMKELNVQKQLIHYGMLINGGWEYIAKKHNIPIEITGIPPLTHLSFKTNDPLAVQTFYAQEMLKKGFLVGSAVYMTFAYSHKLINRFIEASDKVFGKIRLSFATGDIRKCLRGGVIHTGFKRLV